LTENVAFAARSLWRNSTLSGGLYNNRVKPEGVTSMGLLWVLLLLILIFALVGGFAINSWLFLLLIVVLVIALVGYR
jgi:hypothetical protein